MSAKRKSLPTKISQARSSEESLTSPALTANTSSPQVKSHLPSRRSRGGGGRHSPEPLADSDLDYEEEEEDEEIGKEEEEEEIQSEPEESNDVEEDGEDEGREKQVRLCHSFCSFLIIMFFPTLFFLTFFSRLPS